MSCSKPQTRVRERRVMEKETETETEEVGTEKKRPTRTTRTAAVVAGSVWESRMKMDRVKGGIKVFVANATDSPTIPPPAASGADEAVVRSPEKRKRKSWRPVENDKSNSIELRKTLSALPALVDGDDDDEDDDGFEVEVEDKKVDQIWVDEPIVPSSVSKEEDSHPEPPTKDDFYDTISDNPNRFQSFVDLVMWKDIPRSSFMFGIGTFLLISSSYTSDLDFSLISAGSYLGLLHLALIFIYKSFICRAEEYDDDPYDARFQIEEEEARRFVKRVLPFINEFLANVRALFSGDPAIVMKLGVFLFVLAKCGGLITIWTLSKLAFFGVFIIPKLLSSYSSPLSRCGNFWAERCRDSWTSCTHKKLGAAIVFILMWNLCSAMTRIWAVFMLVVVVRYYQQCMAATSEWGDEKNQEKNQEEDNRRLKQPHARKQRREAVAQRGGHIANVEHRQRPLWSTKSSSMTAKTNKKAF